MKVNTTEMRVVADFIDAATEQLERRDYTVDEVDYQVSYSVVIQFKIPGCDVPAYLSAAWREIRMNVGNVSDVIKARIRVAEKTAWQQAA